MNQGLVVGALAKPMKVILTHQEAELVALVRSLEWAKEVGIPFSSVEIDVVCIVQLCSSGCSPHSCYKDVYDDFIVYCLFSLMYLLNLSMN